MNTSSETTELAGRTAVVTGASRGIGAAIASTLAAAGANVVLSGRNEEALETVGSGIKMHGGAAMWMAADVTDPDQLRRLRAAAEDRFGPVGLLVANAGRGGAPASIGALAPSIWRDTIEVNLTGAFLTLREFVPPMIARREGAVVAMSSAAARTVTSASAAYSAAKAGLLALTRSVAAEAAASNVRVNALAPGTVDTETIAALPESVRTVIAAQHPSGRLGTVDDVAQAVLFLLSGRAGWITGHTIDLGARVMN